MNKMSVSSLGSITYEKGLNIDLDRANTMYKDGHVTVIHVFAREMTHAYSNTYAYKFFRKFHLYAENTLIFANTNRNTVTLTVCLFGLLQLIRA